MGERPLLNCVSGDAEWRRIAQNIVSYQGGRLCEQVDLLLTDRWAAWAWTQADYDIDTQGVKSIGFR